MGRDGTIIGRSAFNESTSGLQVGASLGAAVRAAGLPALGDLEGIIARTLGAARAQGRDYMSQSRAAAIAVLAVRPDLSFGQALDAVSRIRDIAP